MINIRKSHQRDCKIFKDFP